MISKATIKRIHALEMRKYRKNERLFVAEGPKLVNELYMSMKPVYVAALPEWIASNANLLNNTTYDTLTPEELQKASLLMHPQQVIALFQIPENELNPDLLKDELILMLDGVQDPGNLGTIARVADWFGIRHIICSPDTADIYNPKAVQATMGALARVKFYYTELAMVLSQYSGPIYGTFLDGNNIYKEELSRNGIIVMGNEGKGISQRTREMINRRLLIPNYPEGTLTTESLNVAIATSIVCAEFRRRSQ
ncbi:MAG: RNA methyltransferase [Bacteroidaceae bacterium]|nr:RNA methyltransferase [Bacteroidaceae bacterium]MBR2946950.1 RNA methyltransferase [Bacteroidaceae bacterium]